MGLYQLLYLDHIPDRAAVDESVKLTKQCRKASASGFVNAVLRSFLRDEKQIPLPKQKKQAISIQYAAPLWLVDLLLKQYGETETIAFLENALQPAPLTIRRNPLLATEEQLLEALQEHQIQKHPLVPDAYFLKGKPPESSGISKGLVSCAGCCLADLLSGSWSKAGRNRTGCLCSSGRKNLYHCRVYAGNRADFSV